MMASLGFPWQHKTCGKDFPVDHLFSSVLCIPSLGGGGAPVSVGAHVNRACV